LLVWDKHSYKGDSLWCFHVYVYYNSN
jgi:hypothetical protein